MRFGIVVVVVDVVAGCRTYRSHVPLRTSVPLKVVGAFSSSLYDFQPKPAGLKRSSGWLGQKCGSEGR